jgi:hypothetical protein
MKKLYVTQWDSAIGIVTGYGLGDRGVRALVLVGARIFYISMLSRLGLEPTQPPIKWISGALSPGVKWPRRQADHSPPTSAKVKKMWVYTSVFPYIFMA